MKITFNFDDRLLRAAKAQATQDGDTLTRLIERALRNYLQPARERPSGFRADLLTKPGATFAGVDPDGRNALYERMDGRDLIAVDTNVLVHAYREDSIKHEAARARRDTRRIAGASGNSGVLHRGVRSGGHAPEASGLRSSCLSCVTFRDI